MKKPNGMSGLIGFIFLCLGLVFVMAGCLCFGGIIKPSANSAVQDPIIMGMIFAVIGVTCCVVQIVLSVFSYKRKKLHQELMANGIRIMGTVENVYLQKWTQFGSTSPYRICYTYDYQGKTYHCKSCLLWNKPKFTKGDDIEVYVNKSGRATIGS